MKRFFALLFALTYGLASSTLVHSFCLEEYQDTTVQREEGYQQEDHGCCDSAEKDNNCYENCLSDITDLTQPAKVDITKISFPGYLTPSLTPTYVLEEPLRFGIGFHPPDVNCQRCEVHIGTTKKLE